MVILGNKKYRELKAFVTNIANTTIAPQIINYMTSQYPVWGVIDEIDKYCTNADIYAVVKRIAENTSLIPMYNYYVVPDEIKRLKQLKSMVHAEFYTAKSLLDIRLNQIKALDDAPDDDPVSIILEQPNKYQNRTAFEETLATYYLVAGEFFIYKLKLDAGANTGKPYNMFAWNPKEVTVHVSGTYPIEVTGYTFTINGVKVLENVPVEDVIHIKTFNPSNPYRGLSPLAAASRIIIRLESAENTSVAQMQNGGLPGVVYDKSIPYDTDAQDILDRKRSAFYKHLKTTDNKGAPYFSAGELGYIPTGLKLADLEVAELQDIDFGRLCNIYKISARLFNRKGDASYNNQVTDAKNAYTQAYLPLKYIIAGAYNTGLLPDFAGDKKQRFVDVDISNIPELQDDMEKMVNTIANMPISITGNEMRALLKYDERDVDAEPWMDMPLIKSGWQFYQDIQTTIPAIDENLLNNAGANDYSAPPLIPPLKVVNG